MAKSKNVLIIVSSIVDVIVILTAMLFVIREPVQVTSSAASHISLAENYLLDLNYEAAIAEYKAAIEIEPKNADFYIALAEVYIEMGDIETAVDVLDEGLNAVDEPDKDRIRAAVDGITKKPTETTTTHENGLIEFGFSNSSGKLIYNDNVIGNEDAVGYYEMFVDITGDYSDVSTFLIGTRADEISSFQIEQTLLYEEVWKDHYADLDYTFGDFNGKFYGSWFPVFEEDIGNSYEVLLYALNKDFDIIGYVIIPVTIE
jgi:tetratricopeptide (TPR) repeat protein